MSEVTNDLIYELLKRVHAKVSEHDQRFQDLGLRLSAIESHLAGFQLAEIRQNSEIDTLRRLDPIEARLDLVES